MIGRRFVALSAIVLGLVISTQGGLAQTKSQLAGTWTLLSFDRVKADGTRRPIFGAKPNGTLILAVDGHYAMVLVNIGRPKKWTGKGRTAHTAEEYKSAASGLLAQFGTWTADDASKTLTKIIEGGLDPTIDKRKRKNLFAIKGDVLTLTQVRSKITKGTRTEQVFRRVKYVPIRTEILDAPPFYFAEDYHQQYLAKNPMGYCGLGGTGVSCPVGVGMAAAAH